MCISFKKKALLHIFFEIIDIYYILSVDTDINLYNKCLNLHYH